MNNSSRRSKLRNEKFGLYRRPKSRHTFGDNNYDGKIFFWERSELPQTKFAGLAKIYSF